MKYSVLNSLPILVLLGSTLTKVQRRKEVWKRSYLPNCSLSFHLEVMQASSWDLCSVGDVSRGQEARPARSQLVASCPWLQEELCPDGMSYPGDLVLLRGTGLSTFSSVPVQVHDLMAFFLPQFSNPSLSICCY